MAGSAKDLGATALVCASVAVVWANASAVDVPLVGHTRIAAVVALALGKAAVPRHAVGLTGGVVAVDLDQHVADEVHRHRVAREHAPEQPLEVLVARAGEAAVLVDGLGPVAVAHEVAIDAVDAAAVAQHHLVDRLLVEQRLDLGLHSGL